MWYLRLVVPTWAGASLPQASLKTPSETRTERHWSKDELAKERAFHNDATPAMTSDEEHRRRLIMKGRERGTCPQCQKVIAEGKGVGTGSFADGLFCSLKCQGEFHRSYYEQRAREGGSSLN